MPSQTDRLNTALAGRYRIERHLGSGGMATVYLADDLKHDRRVAVKVLKPELAAVLGAERFVVEIKTTASLQHPHILPLFDSGTADGFLYYVMPFIEGETLRDKLNRETQLAVDEAVRITREVADALDYAHRRGVIHRDIKPENILLHDGRPMVADFGIALAVSAAAGGRMTETGLSLGTPHYMSPEQATADKEITGRSDVYSLASVLYEMLTGNPPHTGSSAQQIIMKIIAEPVQPVTVLRKSAPPNVASAMARALEKLPADRFGSAKEFADALSNSGYSFGTAALVATPATEKWRKRFIALAGATSLGAIALITLRLTARTADPPTKRFDLSLGNITVSMNSDVVVSPDGSMLAVAGSRSGEQAIFLRHLDGEPDFVKVPGSETGDGSPSFSPDNQWIAFRRGSDSRLVKLSVNGGGATTLAQVNSTSFPFVHWGTDTLLALAGGPATGPILVPSSGGTPDSLGIRGAGRVSFLLPDASGLLFNRTTALWIHDLRSDSLKELLPFAVQAVYVRTGHLLYVGEGGGLYAVPFDLRGHRVTGSPIRVLERVSSNPLVRGYAVSSNGQLVYHDAPSLLSGGGASGTLLVIAAPGGNTDTLRLPPGHRLNPRFAPDGRSLAYEFATTNVGRTDLYTFDLVTGTNTQLTFEGDNDDPVWSPDGKRIAFTKGVQDANGEDVYIKPVDNSAPEQRILSRPGNQNPTSWPDSTTIVVQTATAPGLIDLLVASTKPGEQPRTYLNAPWLESDMHVSPDGKLAVFTSRENDATNVWIRDYPVPQGKWRVSSSGSSSAPRWSRDGNYVYFWRDVIAGADTLFRARIERRPSVVVHPEERVLAMPMLGVGNWDLHPDGKRIVVVIAVRSTAPSDIDRAVLSRYVFVQNWFTELKRLTSGTKP